MLTRPARARTSTGLLAIAATALLAAPTAFLSTAGADFTNVRIVDYGEILPGTYTVRFFVQFDDPSDRLLSVVGDESTWGDAGVLRFESSAPLVQSVTALEDLAFTDVPSIFDEQLADSWVSIGGDWTNGASDTAFSPAFLGVTDGSSAITGTFFEQADSGGYFDSNPATPEGHGAIIASFTLPAGAIADFQGTIVWGNDSGGPFSAPFSTILLTTPCYDDEGNRPPVYTSLDRNGNSVPDECDIINGSSEDVNGDWIPDECQCLGDLDGDETVGFGDLLALLSAWGPCPKGPCPGDLDGDGAVAFGDLLGLLAAWGPC